MILTLLWLNGSIFAQSHLTITQPIDKVLPHKTLRLLQVHLSSKARQTLHQRLQVALQTPSAALHPLKTNGPQAVQLGMNGVPVLDQGTHGTCVTFAVTAALDAVLSRGDYISQLCLLELGQYLANGSYTMSGWNGSTTQQVLHLIHMFGIVPMQTQTAQGCSGLTKYTLTEGDPPNTLSLEAYHLLSQPITEHISWTTLLDPEQFSNQETAMDSTLEQVKMALRGGDRVIVTMLLLPDTGFMGMMAAHQDNDKKPVLDDYKQFDTWVLTPLIAHFSHFMDPDLTIAIHALIITGYDDQAVAIDADGRTHRGLLTLRNSWGKDMGHQGDFYMAYDYFQALVAGLQRVRKFY